MNYYMGQQKIVCCVMYYLLYKRRRLRNSKNRRINPNPNLQIQKKTKNKERTKLTEWRIDKSELWTMILYFITSRCCAITLLYNSSIWTERMEILNIEDENFIKTKKLVASSSYFFNYLHYTNIAILAHSLK